MHDFIFLKIKKIKCLLSWLSKKTKFNDKNKNKSNKLFLIQILDLDGKKLILLIIFLLFMIILIRKKTLIEKVLCKMHLILFSFGSKNLVVFYPLEQTRTGAEVIEINSINFLISC